MNEATRTRIYRPLSPVGRDSLVHYLRNRYDSLASLYESYDMEQIANATDDTLHAYGESDGALYGDALDNVLEAAPETWSKFVAVVAATIRNFYAAPPAVRSYR